MVPLVACSESHSLAVQICSTSSGSSAEA